MNRILSWKISIGTYAYIYLPNSSSRISSRIPEDSPIWSTILNTISGWDKSTYKAEFDKMAAEVEGKYGVKLSWKDEYFSFGDNGATNIVLLAGKDGVDGSNGGSSNNGDSSSGGTWDEVYDEFNKKIDEKLDGVKEDIERNNKEVKDFIENEVTETVTEAKQTISDTKKELDNIRKDLEERLGGAAEALNKAAALFEMGEGGIDGEAIKDALSSVKEYGSWLEEYSGCVQSLKTDYDIATTRMGSIGEAEDVKDGLFARFATSLNVISGTVGNVERNMNASQGSIKDMASWYDVYASAATEVVRFMSASGGVIDDTISHISDSGDNGYTAFLRRQMDAKDAAIKDVIMTETRSGITNITRDMNALSGTISDNIVRLSAIDSALTSMGRRMDASDFTMEQYMTKTDSALTAAIDLRDHWSAESGKISTVASLTAQVDGEGNVMYFVSGSTGSESDDIRVWKGDDGVWRDANGVTYKEEDVIVHYSNMMASYIQQQTSAITMSIMSGDSMSAAIKLAISGDSSIISMVADEVVIDANVIANAISAKTANIGGILIGDGKIECIATKGDNPLFSLNGHDGSLYAQNAYIEGTVRATSGQFNGAVTATSLTLGPNYGDKSITDYIDDKIPSDVTSSTDVKNMINDYVNSPEFKDSITNGYITEEDLQKWADSQSGLTEDQVKDLIEQYGNTQINTTFTSTSGNGQTKYTLTIGGEQYEWYTYELKDQDGNGFVLLDRPYTGDTESGVTSVLVSTNGLLQAHNAIIHGCIYAMAGEIGGLKLSNSRLMVSRNGNYNDSIAYLNGSNTYADSERGTIILAAGVNTGSTTYYKYVSSQAPDGYKIIYTKRKYSTSVGDYNNTEVVAYTIQKVNGVDKFVRCENQFYFIIEKVVSAAGISEDDIVVALSDSEENVKYKESVVRKYTIETSPDGDIDVVYDYYSYEGTITSTDSGNANTILYEDGTLFTETIIANGGYFSGELDAKGRFSGELQDATGTLKGVTVEANYLTGNIVLNTSNSLKAKGGQELYFNVGKEKLTDLNTKEYWNVDEVFWERKNANGKNAGQTYTKTLTIASVPFKSGATVTIPAFSGSVYRYAPAGKTNKTSNVKIVCSYRYNGESNSQELINKTIPLSSFKGAGNKTNTLSTEKKSFETLKDGVLTIKFTYDIHLSTYSWLGADKAYCKITFNAAGSKINVEYKQEACGTSIASNGMRVLTSGGAKISAIDNKIELLSPNAQYGLQITDSGIKYRKAGGSWTNLN